MWEFSDCIKRHCLAIRDNKYYYTDEKTFCKQSNEGQAIHLPKEKGQKREITPKIHIE
jgi:hypothetical protein